MKKIPTALVRDEQNRRYVTGRLDPRCDWVLDSAAVPTRKWDGTCARLDDNGRWWMRREVKPGRQPPPNFEEIETDPVTGKTVGWEPADQSGFARYLEEVIARLRGAQQSVEPGTYELCGPKINGNPEGFVEHHLLRHGTWVIGLPMGFWEEPGRYLHEMGFEGIVWYNESTGAMAKLKARDFPEGRGVLT